MRRNKGVATGLIIVLLALPGCAAIEARERLNKVAEDNRLRVQAGEKAWRFGQGFGESMGGSQPCSL